MLSLISIFVSDSNIVRNGVLQQNKFLTDVITALDNDTGKNIILNLQKVRETITDPSNVVLYVAGNLDYLKNPEKPLECFLPPEVQGKSEK